jgi:hypothetical protein
MGNLPFSLGLYLAPSSVETVACLEAGGGREMANMQFTLGL